MSRLDFDFFSPVFGSADEGIFKAGAERSETRGAAEVQEDEDTQVEVPVDQVMLTPLSTHGNWKHNFGSLMCSGAKGSHDLQSITRHPQFFPVPLQRISTCLSLM